METTASNELVAFLQKQAGEYLRSAIHYDEEDYELLYLREDLSDIEADTSTDEFVAYYRQKSREQDPERPFDLGNDHCTVSIYDEAILFHFTQGANVGTIITLSPEAGRDIIEFTTKCLEQLHRNSPQDIDAVPKWLQA
jgi:hypothetical protein